MEGLGTRLVLAETYVKAALEMLSMCARNFRYITDHGTEVARQMAYLFGQGDNAVHSEYFMVSRKSLIGQWEVEATKKLTKAILQRATKNNKKCGAKVVSDS